MVKEGGDAGEWSHVQFASVTCPQSVCTPCGGNTGRSGHLLPEQKVGRWLGLCGCLILDSSQTL